MSNAIAFLEMMGKEAGLRHAEPATLHRVMSEQQVDPETAWAILAGHGQRLEALLGADAIRCCSLFPGKEDDDDGEEEPSREDEVSFERVAGVRAAAA